MTPRSRTLTALAAGALLLGTAVPALAQGEQDPPGAQEVETSCEGVPAGYEPFTDVEGNQFEQEVLCLAYAKVTRGGAGGAPASSYSPEALVERGAMASFVARLMDLADSQDAGEQVRALPQYDGTPSFSDVAGTTHEASIGRLADAGIVTGGPAGFPADRYVPAGSVTRAQMATFLDRALEYLLGEPVSTTDDYYTDDAGNVHEPRINDVTSVGIAGGRAPDTYAPGALVDRDNMAAFLARTLGELEERRAVEPLAPPAEDDITVEQKDDVAVNAVTNPDRTTADDRTYTVTGLAPGEEYRVTLVEASTVDGTGSQAVFTEDGDTGLAAVGVRTADLTTINGNPNVNNTGDGTARTRTDSTNGGTGVADATADGELTFVVDLDAGSEAVVPVVYRNGSQVNADADGGQSPRLELDEDGTAAEAVDTGGVFGENIAVDDAQVFRVALPNPDGSTVDDRTYQVTGLVPGEEYRVTLLGPFTAGQDEAGETTFAEDGDTGLAAVGMRTADITFIDGAAAANNTGDGTTRTANAPDDSGTAVFTAGPEGTASFQVDPDEGDEAVRPVVYRNGGPRNSVFDGGSSPRLELEDDGTAKEVFDLGGDLIVAA
jgi:hypothetical protein